MKVKGRPLVFLFKGKPEESGAARYPDCVTFQIYMGGQAHTEVISWLDEMCPSGYQFGHARVWRKHGTSSYRDSVPVLHIFDRGIAAMFKMVFCRTQQEQRLYEHQQRIKNAAARIRRRRTQSVARRNKSP